MYLGQEKYVIHLPKLSSLALWLVISCSFLTRMPQVVRRQNLRRKSTLSTLLWGEDDAEALKAKNIKQTELVAALREAIGRTAEHFHCLDPRNGSTVRPYHNSERVES